MFWPGNHGSIRAEKPQKHETTARVVPSSLCLHPSWKFFHPCQTWGEKNRIRNQINPEFPWKFPWNCWPQNTKNCEKNSVRRPQGTPRLEVGLSSIDLTLKSHLIDSWYPTLPYVVSIWGVPKYKGTLFASLPWFHGKSIESINGN